MTSYEKWKRTRSRRLQPKFGYFFDSFFIINQMNVYLCELRSCLRHLIDACKLFLFCHVSRQTTINRDLSMEDCDSSPYSTITFYCLFRLQSTQIFTSLKSQTQTFIHQASSLKRRASTRMPSPMSLLFVFQIKLFAWTHVDMIGCD